MIELVNKLYVISPQHTGTWFTLDFLESHPDIEGVYVQTKWDQVPIEGGHIVMHAHVPFSVYKGGDVLPDTFKCIVPIRDPLKSIITRECRAAHRGHEDIIDGFIAAINLPNAYYLPIDLPDLEVPDRVKLLAGVCRHLGINDECDEITQWANEWPVRNDSYSSHYLKVEYRQGKLDVIQKMMPEAYSYLKQHQNVLQPFLQDLGYTTLPWWY